MKKNFFAPSVVIVVVGSICAAFIISGSIVLAYEIPSGGQLPVPQALSTTESSQGENFGQSLNSLAAPFENFFNSMNHGGFSVPMNFTMGGNNVSSTITVGINVQQYINQWINQFDAWFYQHTGVHIEWLFNIFIGIVYWVWWLADSVVRWIVGLFH